MKARGTPSLVAVLAIGVLAGCASSPAPPVEIAGPAADLRALAGDWTGLYAYTGGLRSGSIRFQLSMDPGAEATTAFGDVLMIPADIAEPRHQPANDNPTGRIATAEALQIRFVAVQHGMISGTMEPYRDPTSGAILSTTFTGRVAGDAIEGTFLAFGGQPNVPLRGTWKVTRGKLGEAAKH